jgi:glycosyltransferase involved in cell wall biosynthesis
MKVLFVASVYRHFTAFHLPYLNYFQNLGYEVWVAGSGQEDKETLEKLNIKCIDIPFSRSPLSIRNIESYKLLKKLFNTEIFDLVHVHTPVAALLARMAFRKTMRGKIVYTAHGFHFFEGAPKKNWLIFYTAEKLAARWTDHLITINSEDYKNAQKLLPEKKISFVHGVGVELGIESLSNNEKLQFKNSLGLADNSCVISYIAELNANKNHQFLLKNWKEIKQVNPTFELLIIGAGENEQQLKEYVINEQLTGIHFLGFRRDVPKILQITDVVTLLSYREGLPKSIMEAMSVGIPCVVTNTRGLRDLIISNENGLVIDHEDNKELVKAFCDLNQEQLRIEMGIKGREMIKPFLLDNVIEEYKIIYNKLLS